MVTYISPAQTLPELLSSRTDMWTCRLIEWTPETKQKDLVPGDMFFAPEAVDDVGYWPFIFSREKLLSDYYWKYNSHRRPLLVWLPGQFIWCLDAMWGGKDGLWGGHHVTGEVPKISLDVELKFADVFRGTITDGVISDDLDGRSFRPNGERAGTSSS